MDIKDWVRAARDHKGWSQKQLGEVMSRTKANIGHWETGKHEPSLSQVLQIAKETGYPLPTFGIEGAHKSNVETTNGAAGEVPLISWVAAGAWDEAVDNFQPGDADEWVPCVRKHSRYTYALRVKGDSMTAPHGNTRSYPEGCIIFVDPARKLPANGERIIAKLEGSAEVTFKTYKEEDGRRWLQPLNPSHEPIRDPFKVLGTVIGKWEDE